MSTPVITLKTVVFEGSARTTAPMWGGDARLGERVQKWLAATLEKRGGVVGSDATSGKVLVKYETTFFDPIEVFGTVSLPHRFPPSPFPRKARASPGR